MSYAKSLPTLTVRDVDQHALARCWELLRHEPVVKFCRDALLRYILADGIMIHRDNKDHPLLEETGGWSTHDAEHMVTGALDWLLTAGVVPLARHGDQLSVIPYGTGHLKSSWVGHQQTFTWVSYEKGAFHTGKINDYDPHVIVLYGWGWDPHPMTGTLSSPLATLLRSYDFLTKMFLYAEEAENFRARPPLILQERPDNSQKELHLGVDYGIVGTADFRRPLDHEKYYRTRHQIESLKNTNKEIERDYYGIEGASAKDSLSLEDSIRIPSSYELVHPTYPSLRNDLIALKKSFADEVFCALGVPQALIHAQGTLVGAKSTGEDQFRQNIRAWKRKLENILTFGYRISLGVSELERLMAKAKRRHSPPTPAELSVIDQSVDVRCILPTSPFMTIEETIQMFKEGAMTYEEKVQYIRQLKGLPPLPVKAIKALAEELRHTNTVVMNQRAKDQDATHT